MKVKFKFSIFFFSVSKITCFQIKKKIDIYGFSHLPQVYPPHILFCLSLTTFPYRYIIINITTAYMEMKIRSPLHIDFRNIKMSDHRF